VKQKEKRTLCSMAKIVEKIRRRMNMSHRRKRNIMKVNRILLREMRRPRR